MLNLTRAIKTVALTALLSSLTVTAAAAQDRDADDRKYVVGIRSALITGTMPLSGLDPAFGDLAADGPEGPHMSGFYFMMKVRRHLRVGVETLVSSSDKDEATTMNYQAAGPVVELHYGRRWYVAGSLHAGGLIVNAMARTGAAPAQGASTGSFYKGEGFFVAPTVDVGYRFRRMEVGMFVKRVNVLGEKERGGLSGFNATFVGLRFGVGL